VPREFPTKLLVSKFREHFQYVIHFYRYLALATPTWRVEKYPKPSEINVFKIPGNYATKFFLLSRN